MKKRLLIVLLSVCIAIISAFAFTACGETNSDGGNGGNGDGGNSGTTATTPETPDGGDSDGLLFKDVMLF